MYNFKAGVGPVQNFLYIISLPSTALTTETEKATVVCVWGSYSS